MRGVSGTGLGCRGGGGRVLMVAVGEVFGEEIGVVEVEAWVEGSAEVWGL